MKKVVLLFMGFLSCNFISAQTVTSDSTYYSVTRQIIGADTFDILRVLKKNINTIIDTVSVDAYKLNDFDMITDEVVTMTYDSVGVDTVYTNKVQINIPISSPPSGAEYDDYLAARAELGDIGKYSPIGISPFLANSGTSIGDGFLNFYSVYIPKTDTISGVCWTQQTSYTFVADHNNKVGLYSYSGGTLTLVASSANDGNLWKSGTGRKSKAFTAPVAVSKGVYYIATLLNGSSGTISANITRSVLNISSTMQNNGFANSAILHGSLSAQTDLPATLNINTLSANTNELRIFQLY